MRSCAGEEIVKTVITIVTRTITHILVVCHLVLIAQSASNLVFTHIVGYIVLYVEDSIAYLVVPCKQFVAQGDIVLTLTVQDVDEGEFCRFSVTDRILHVRIGCQELV